MKQLKLHILNLGCMVGDQLFGVLCRIEIICTPYVTALVVTIADGVDSQPTPLHREYE